MKITKKIIYMYYIFVMLTIYPLISNNQQQYKSNKNLNFGYRLPQKAVSDMRDISHLTCASCGREMLKPEVMNKFMKSFMASSARALENSVLNRFKDSWAFNFVKELSKDDPQKTINDLLKSETAQKQLQNVDAHKKIMLGEFMSVADKITLKAPRVMQKLSKYYDHFCKEDKEILDLMEVYAAQYPKNTFAEIFQKPEVAQHHTELFQTYKKQAMEQKIDVFKRLKEFSKKLPAQDVKKLQVTNNEALKVLNNAYYKPHIKQACVEDIYNNFLKNCETKRIRKKIFDIIKDIPYESPAADEFIAMCAQNKISDKDIVSKFAQEMSATFEHVKAKSQKGEDTIENGIVLCKKCNTERSNIPYRIYLKIHPEMKKNIQKQINKIITFINHKKLLGYDNYPVDIKKTLLNETDNLIKIKIKRYLKYREQQVLKRLEFARASYGKDKETADNAIQKLNTIEAVMHNLLEEIKQLKKDKHRVNDVLTKAEQSCEHYKDVIEKNQLMFDEISKLIADDTLINQTVKPKKI